MTDAVDRDALRRCIEWAAAFQRRKPSLKVFPPEMPPEFSPEWIKLAEFLAGQAQIENLSWYAWQCPPAYSIVAVPAPGTADLKNRIEAMRDFVRGYDGPPTDLATDRYLLSRIVGDLALVVARAGGTTAAAVERLRAEYADEMQRTRPH